MANNKIEVVLTEKALKDIIEKEHRRNLALEIDSWEAFDTIMTAAERTRDGDITFRVSR